MSMRDDTSRHSGVRGNRPGRVRGWMIALGLMAVLMGALFVVSDRTRASGWHSLQSIRATSDEGYLYLLLQTDGRKGQPDWNDVVYRIAIDTYDPDRGERRLPKPFEAEIMSGAEFLVELAGPKRSSLRVTPSYNPYPLKGRAEEGAWIVSPPRSSGQFVPLTFEANRERFGRDGRRYPPAYRDRGTLLFLRDGDRAVATAITDVAVGNEGAIEIRIPWSLLNIADPAAHRVLHGESRVSDSETLETDGFRFYAYSFSRARGKDPLDQLPEPGHRARLYRWRGWTQPTYRLELKEGVSTIAATMQSLPNPQAPVEPVQP